MEEIKPLNLNSEETAQPKMPDSASKPTMDKPKKKMVKWVVALVLLGVVSGWGLVKIKQPSSPKKLKSAEEAGVNSGDTYGVMDEAAFPDMAEGKLVAGGIDGEGSHHLEREGGESQYVYLTSSVIDLDQFVDKEVKVWGQTFEAQKAGWLMDVGRLQVK